MAAGLSIIVLFILRVVMGVYGLLLFNLWIVCHTLDREVERFTVEAKSLKEALLVSRITFLA